MPDLIAHQPADWAEVVMLAMILAFSLFIARKVGIWGTNG